MKKEEKEKVVSTLKKQYQDDIKEKEVEAKEKENLKELEFKI